MVSFFILYTPFHAEYARLMIRQHFGTDFNVLVNHYSVEVTVTAEEPVAEVQNIGASIFKSLGGIRRLKTRWLQMARAGTAFRVFIPHTLGILANFAYHRLAGSFPHVKVNVYYEGVILFYNYDHGYLDNFRYYASRWAASWLAGINYVIDKRLLNFYDPRIHRIYTPFTSIEAAPEKIVETPLAQLEFEPDRDCALVLGLVLLAKQEGELKKIIAAIYAKIKELNLTRVYYKEHPLDKSPLFAEMAARSGINLLHIRDKSPVEKIVHHYRPAAVFSSWSSGVINLRSILPGGTQMYCFLTEAITRDAESRKLVEAFRREQIIVEYV